MNPYRCILVALLSTAGVGLAQAPQAAIVTGEVHNAPSREVEFSHEPLLAPGPSQHHIVLDAQNRFALLLNIAKGTFVTGSYKGKQHVQFPFFVEPGDSLHAVVTFAEVAEAVESDSLYSAADEVPPSYSLTFSGRGAENNRFLAEFWPQHSAFEPDYVLESGEFTRQAEQRRRDEFALLAEGREQYALSPGFIDYTTAFINYKWANQMIAYTRYSSINGVLGYILKIKPFNSRHPVNSRAVPLDYYDFLQEVPLIDEKAIGVQGYRRFVVNALDLEAKSDRPDRLVDSYKLSGLGLSSAVLARLDSMYNANRDPKLSQMIDLAELDLAESAQAELDSMYQLFQNQFDANTGGVRASEKAAWLGLELSPATQAQLDSYEGHRMSYSMGMEDTTMIDTTGGSLTFHIPVEKINEWFGYIQHRPLSAKVDLAGLELSPAAQAQLDSMYQNRYQDRKRLRPAQRIDLATLGLAEETQAQLDSIFAGPYSSPARGYVERYDLAKQKLHGRVLYWFLTGELMDGIKHDFAAFVDARWPSFAEGNPFPEYTEALKAEQNKLSTLQPGQSAPDFALQDLDGQPVSLSQFKGKVVLLDFWASWCGPCIGDLETLRQIKDQVAAQPVVFLNVSLDANEAAWKQAIAKHEIQGVHVRSEQVAQAYNVSGIPRYYLVDPQGLIVEDRLRVFDVDEVVAKIKKHL